MQSFCELSISPYLQKKLLSAGFSKPTPVQARSIPCALDGQDIVATAQTGTGKTLAFVIPIIEKLLGNSARGIVALVLVPTRELAMQIAAQFDILRGRELRPAALMVGGLPERQQLDAVRAGAGVVIATPGRLGDFLNRGLIDFRELRTLVLDEADRMLDMGFLPAIRRIVGALPRDRQTMCFSATMEGDTARIVKDYTKNPARLTFGSTLKPSENVRLQAFEVTLDDKQRMLHRLLAQESGRCLVFSRTKRGAERIAKALTRKGVPTAVIHGDRSQSQRTAALDGFQRGRHRVLVATDLAARGIHVQDIVHVINYDLPEVAENFIHRVGRTGRAGSQGLASTLFVPGQRSELFQLERTLSIRMERLGTDGYLTETVIRSGGMDNMPSAPRHRMVPLPGEVLQAQMGAALQV